MGVGVEMTHIDIAYVPFSVTAPSPARMHVVPVTFWGIKHNKYSVELHRMELYYFLEGEWVEA